MIYLDNPATSWPKPEVLTKTMNNFINNIGANPGRAGHQLAIESGELLFDAREAIAKLFSATNPLNVAFMSNITEALNCALVGILKPGDHIITSSMEHNSVMRPLRFLEKQGVIATVIKCDSKGYLNPDEIIKSITTRTKMVCINHASNVTGTIQPIKKIGSICKKAGVLFLVDTAQSAGSLEISMTNFNIDLLTFTGHKALFGPMGTGGLIIGEKIMAEDCIPLIRGGTGSFSEKEDQPDFFPDALESGTPNMPGIAGLLASINWLTSEGMEKIKSKEMVLTKQLLHGLSQIDRVTLFGPEIEDERTPVVSFIIEDLSVSDVGTILNDKFGICSRVGLHCTPSAHKTIGTYPTGTIRLGPGYFTTEKEIDGAILAVKNISKRIIK